MAPIGDNTQKFRLFYEHRVNSTLLDPSSLIDRKAR
jgi:hypothetical protein